jgi:hypothetical protein
MKPTVYLVLCALLSAPPAAVAQTGPGVRVRPRHANTLPAAQKPDAPASPFGTTQVPAYPQRMAERFTSKDGLPQGRIDWIRADAGVVIAGVGRNKAFRFAGDRWTQVQAPAPPDPGSVMLPPGLHDSAPVQVAVRSSVPAPDGSRWIVTESGAFHDVGGRLIPVTKPQIYLTRQDTPNIDASITCFAIDGNGQVWMGSDGGGVYVSDGANYWYPLDRRARIPYETVTCVAFGPTGDLWVGTPIGVCRYTDGGVWQFFSGRRWLPNDEVNGIAVAADGSAWVATSGGVARLYDKRLSLAQKAAHYEEITLARHNRRGYVTDGALKVPGDPSGGIINDASDNDGLWTSVYVSAEAFRWAATHDPQARELAHKSMFAMLDMVKYTGVPGFPARALIFKGDPPVSGYSADETVRIPGETEKIWFQSPVDPNVLCKGDTSSDETDGHYFAWLNYYDLVADAKEKRAVADVVRACTDNILSHNLFLYGHTGRRTLWGVWNPSYINEDPRWWEERGINSLEILAYLRIADHVTGDPKYMQKYHELIEKHHYLLNLITQKVADPWWGVNHSDDEMSFMMYYSLLKLERDPQTRLVLLASLDRSWRVSRPDHSPFFNFVYGSMTGRPCDVEESVEELEAWPWELINWRMDNGRRTDVQFHSANLGRDTKVETMRSLPASERWIMKWNGNPYEIAGGDSDGRNEQDGGAWLLPYWMGRYHQIIGEYGMPVKTWPDLPFSVGRNRQIISDPGR